MKVISFEKTDEATAKLVAVLSQDELAVKQEEDATLSRSNAARSLISAELEKAFREKKLKPVGVPTVYLRDLESSSEIEVTISIELFPEPEIRGYDAIEVAVPGVEVSDTQVAEIISDMIVAHSGKSGERHEQVTLDDHLAEEIVPGVGGADGLRSHVKQLEEERLNFENTEAVRDGVFRWLLARNQFPVPGQMIDDEIRSILVQGEIVPSDMASSAGTIEITAELRRKYQDAARERVRLAVIIDRISEIEDVQAREEDIEQAIHDLARSHDSTYAETREYLMENGFIMEVILGVIQDSVLRFLLERTTVHRQPLQ